MEYGIYKDEFVKLLKDTLGHIKITANNLIVPCPWCEYGKNKEHYHLYVSLNLPIFHCFKAGCPKESGTVKQLIQKLSGISQTDSYVYQEKIKEIKIENKTKIKTKKFILPEINECDYILKSLYLKKRFGYNNLDIPNIKGLIFSPLEFVRINNLKLTEEQQSLLPFLESSFIGFITEHQTIITFRNIDSNATFGFYKMYLNESDLLDYYSLKGYGKNTNKIVLAEGIFDIYSEYLLDTLGIKTTVYMYAAGLSFSYKSLIKSIIFDENIFSLDILILSDRDVKIEKYRNLKKDLKYVINTLEVIYNRGGKDFNTYPIIHEHFKI